MDNNNQFSMLDFITIIAFLVGIQNLEENRQQSKSQEEILQKLEEHLEVQDKQYEEILKKLNEKGEK